MGGFEIYTYIYIYIHNQDNCLCIDCLLEFTSSDPGKVGFVIYTWPRCMSIFTNWLGAFKTQRFPNHGSSFIPILIMKFVAGTATKGAKKISKGCCWFRWATEINEIKMSQGGKVRPMVLHDKGCWLSLIFPGLVVSLFKVGNSKGQSTTDHQLVSYQHYSALNQHWNQLA